MKSILLTALLICLCVSVVPAQTQNPFIFSAFGGLFFPSAPGFQGTYQTRTDVIWGGGISTPIGGAFYIMSDIGFFKAETFPGSIDTSVTLRERFIHVGVLMKYHLTQTFFLRTSAGISYSTVMQKNSGSTTPETELNADNSLGYFGGLGLEQMLDPHWTIHTEIVYDYRRSRAAELPGDFGGTRLVAGVNMIVF